MPNRYTVAEVARLYGVHPESVKRWLRSGKLKGTKTPGGRSWIIYADDLFRDGGKLTKTSAC